ncbi:OmpA family protein [candidate division GN15 bacterium]|nr:OmpA family protein [candidate division GN15 bacterium]
MKTFVVMTLALSLLLIGCGVNKEYVNEQIAQSESRMGSRINSVSETAEANAADVQQLQQLAQQLEEKADMAINKAAGFENYQIIWEGTINFEFDQYEITDVAAGILDEAGMKLEGNPGAIIEIAGHTDRTGPARYNLILGEMRATAAKRYLADRFGISLYRMFTTSYGEDKPTAMPDEQNTHSRNRRVSLTIWGNVSSN